MVRAYVLVQVQPKTEKKVVEQIKKIKEVKRADIVFGEYDIVAIVETTTISKLSEIISKIRSKIKGVVKTSTMITQEGYFELLKG